MQNDNRRMVSVLDFGGGNMVLHMAFGAEYIPEKEKGTNLHHCADSHKCCPAFVHGVGVPEYRDREKGF